MVGPLNFHDIADREHALRRENDLGLQVEQQYGPVRRRGPESRCLVGDNDQVRLTTTILSG